MNTEIDIEQIKTEPIEIDKKYESFIVGCKVYLNEAYGEPPLEEFRIKKDFEILQREFSELIVSNDELRKNAIDEIFESLISKAYALGAHHALNPDVEFDSNTTINKIVQDAANAAYANAVCGEEAF
jgi:hypothetical protein